MQIGVAKYNAIYGSFATIPLFLAWVWVAWLFVLIGAQLAYAIQNEPTYHFTTRTAAPSLRLSAALDICRTVGERFQAALRTENEDLIDSHRDYPPELVGATVDTLVKAGLLHHSSETGELILALPPERISGRLIVEAVLGTETPETIGGDQAARAVAGASAEFVDGEPQNAAVSQPEQANHQASVADQQNKTPASTRDAS